MPSDAVGGEPVDRLQKLSKRKISGGTVSDAGKNARDVLLGLMKTCMKLDVSFFCYLGDRLGIPAQETIPSLPDLVRQAA